MLCRKHFIVKPGAEYGGVGLQHNTYNIYNTSVLYMNVISLTLF